MIEKFSPSELEAIVRELKCSGYDLRPNSKANIFNDEVKQLFGNDVYVSQTLRNAIYQVADYITGNYEKKGNAERKVLYVAPDKVEEYQKIIKGCLEVIRPAFGMTGFCKKR